MYKTSEVLNSLSLAVVKTKMKLFMFVSNEILSALKSLQTFLFNINHLRFANKSRLQKEIGSLMLVYAK